MKLTSWVIYAILIMMFFGCDMTTDPRQITTGTMKLHMNAQSVPQPLNEADVTTIPMKIAESDYPWQRGPNRNDVITNAGKIPMKWGEKKNIQWQRPIPGTGSGSPILIGDKIFLTTVEDKENNQIAVSLISLTRKTGEPIDKKIIRSGKKPTQVSQGDLYPSATIASDGQLLFYPYVVDGHLYLDCFHLDLKPCWSRDLGEYNSVCGYFNSPIVYGDTVILCVTQQQGPCYLGAFERTTGKDRWQTKREVTDPRYTTATLIHSSDRDQIIVNSSATTISYSPHNGQILWTANDPANGGPSSLAWDDKRVYLAGVSPSRVLAAISTDGKGETIWSTRRPIPPCFPNLVYHEGLIYSVSNESGIYCLDALSGTIHWSEKLTDKFFSSPIIVGNRLYIFGQSGKNWVFQTGKKINKLTENQLDLEIRTTPVPADNGIYLRSNDSLYFISEMEE